jgi:NAD(P)H-hydrate repair Nnr-like enzyme with NAD(P)H-hydrate dehydratase domain
LILTPHDGELKQLFLRLGVGVDLREFLELGARFQLAERASNLVGQTVLLKGSISIVAQPGMTPVTVGPNSPHLATAGTGDVLAGILGALAAISNGKPWQGWAPIAELAILLHSAAADETAKTGAMVAGRLSEQVSKLIRGALV